ncbi:hypothetical protein N431DRAFT_60342 [Stipitochalara longipes BDJ]|nr:hypothetical protein N431DRAFT_60342 [Stipitochalara longipes BDJ]
MLDCKKIWKETMEGHELSSTLLKNVVAHFRKLPSTCSLPHEMLIEFLGPSGCDAHGFKKRDMRIPLAVPMYLVAIGDAWHLLVGMKHKFKYTV